MKRGSFSSVQEQVVAFMIENKLDEVTKYGINFNTEKKEDAIPTGITLPDGRMVHVQP